MKQRVTVIGGGVVGLATAYALVREGWSVDLIEARDSLASATSFANGGQLSRPCQRCGCAIGVVRIYAHRRDLAGQCDFGQHGINARIVRHDAMRRNRGLAGATGQGKSHTEA